MIVIIDYRMGNLGFVKTMEDSEKIMNLLCKQHSNYKSDYDLFLFKIYRKIINKIKVLIGKKV